MGLPWWNLRTHTVSMTDMLVTAIEMVKYMPEENNTKFDVTPVNGKHGEQDNVQCIAEECMKHYTLCT